MVDAAKTPWQHAAPAGRKVIAHTITHPASLSTSPDMRARRVRPNPGPRAQAVMRDREPQSREERVPLVARRHHPLRDVPAAARFLPGIPAGPPLHADEREERRHRQRQRRPRYVGCGSDARDELERRRRQLRVQAGNAATARNSANRERDGALIANANWKKSVTTTPQSRTAGVSRMRGSPAPQSADPSRRSPTGSRHRQLTQPMMTS